VLLVQCDGQDFTAKIRELKFHCLLFLNIPRYVLCCYGTIKPERDVVGFLFVAKFSLVNAKTFKLH